MEGSTDPVGEIVIRFLIGGVVVSLFAVCGDLFRPKSFAGLFGAAPSVALATLGLTFAKKDGGYAATEGRSMLLGALALFVYTQLVAWLLMRRRWSPPAATIAALVPWLAVAFGLWYVLLAGRAAG